MEQQLLFVPKSCAKNEKAGSEEPAIYGIINYVE